jgi:Flp pilus assembly protein TadG
MMKLFSKFSSKQQKGQILVIVAFTILGLVAIIGLAVDSGYMYLRYSYLNRAVDAAVLAASGEFRNYNDDNLRDSYIRAAALQLLDLNKIVFDPSAAFSDPVTGIPGYSVETCHENNGEPDVVAKLCATPLEKIVRVTVQEQVPTFFLAVIGIRSVPIMISSYSTAASLDVILVLDTSASMALGPPETLGMGDPPDPKDCNLGNQCQPMLKVKNAAKLFANTLYLPYDRLGLVGFDQKAKMYLPLSTNLSAIWNAIDGLKVYEGAHSLLTDGSSPSYCIYYQQYKNVDPNDHAYDFYRTYGEDISNPLPYTGTSPAYYWDWLQPQLDDQPPRPSFPDNPNNPNYAGTIEGPCRLFEVPGGSFWDFDCPTLYGATPDPSRCGTTNLADSIAMAGAALTGAYPAPFDVSPPPRNDTAVWALVALSDGRATAGYGMNGSPSPGLPICPTANWPSKKCRDSDAKTRHCLSAFYYTAMGIGNEYTTCMANKYPADPGGNPLGTVTENVTLYDVDDAARDAFDLVASNNTLVFTIGLGPNIPYPPVLNAVEHGETLLNYGATVGHGAYKAAPSSSDLASIFQEIAKLIISRINQ